MFDDGGVIAIEYAFSVAHASGETWPHQLRQTGVSRCRDSKGGWDDKALNKCHTAARKYFLLSLFQIPTGEESDADRGENDRAAPRKKDARSSLLSLDLGREHAYGPFYHVRQHALNPIIAATVSAFHLGP